jgi:hypothetical protein
MAGRCITQMSDYCYHLRVAYRYEVSIIRLPGSSANTRVQVLYQKRSFLIQPLKSLAALRMWVGPDTGTGR